MFLAFKTMSDCLFLSFYFLLKFYQLLVQVLYLHQCFWVLILYTKACIFVTMRNKVKYLKLLCKIWPNTMCETGSDPARLLDDITFAEYWESTGTGGAHKVRDSVLCAERESESNWPKDCISCPMLLNQAPSYCNIVRYLRTITTETVHWKICQFTGYKMLLYEMFLNH